MIITHVTYRLSKHPQHENKVKAGKSFEYYENQFGGFDDKSLITKVEAVNPTTLRITLKAPQGPFLANLGMFTFDIASPAAVEKYGLNFGKNPVGTGPYKFVEWKVGQQVVLEANKDYWDKAHAAKIPRVVVRNIKDNSQRLAALKAGEIHGFEGLNPDDLKVVKADPNLQVLLRPTNTTGYVAFNYKVKEFQDGRIRQAIAQGQQVVGVEASVLELRRGQRTLGPIGALKALVDLDSKLGFQQRAQTHGGPSQDTRGDHGIEDIGELETEIPPQADQVVLRGVEDLLDLWVGQNRT